MNIKKKVIVGLSLALMGSLYYKLAYQKQHHNLFAMDVSECSSKHRHEEGENGSVSTYLGNAPREPVYLEKLVNESKTLKKKWTALETILLDGSNNKYDYLPLLTTEKVSSMINPVYKIKDELTLETVRYVYDQEGKATEQRTKQTSRTIGTGVIIKKAEQEQKILVLTARHVVQPPSLPSPKNDDQGRPLSVTRIIDHKIILVTSETDRPVIETGLSLTPLCVSQNVDLVFLEAYAPTKEVLAQFTPAPSFGNSSELSPGQIIYLVGFPFSLTKIYSSGIVLSLGSPYQSWDDTNFYTNATSNPGNSGGPAYAMRDGQPELVGILSWGIRNSHGLHGVVKVDEVKTLLAECSLPSYFK